MKNRLFILAVAIMFILAPGCSQTKTKKKAIGGAESSIYQLGDIKNVKITADTSKITSGCANNSPVIQTGNKGTQYDVMSKVGDWYALKLPNNQIGFIPNGQCKPVVVDNKPNKVPENQLAVPQGTTSPKTPTTKNNSGTLTSQEKQMLDLINASRSQNNLPPLKADMSLTNVARIKAQDMITNHYFSHYSPRYGSPFDMMKAFGINYIQAGENIAGNQTVQNAENALMNSPGHRKNILSPDFTHIGIGIKPGGPYGNMFSQMFITK